MGATDETSITPRGIELPEGAARPFGALEIARRLLRITRDGALATLDPTGHPLVTRTVVATDLEGAPLLMASKLSLHTRNMEADPRVSLLLAQDGKGDPLSHPRLTLVGRIGAVEEPFLRERFLRRNPKSKLYAGLPDFKVYRLEVTGVHLNGGPGRAEGLTADALLLDAEASRAFRELEPGAVAHMNEDHGDALSLYAVHYGRAEAGPWSVTGLDPEGMDLALDDRSLRICYPRPLAQPGELRPMLVEMAKAARAAAG